MASSRTRYFVITSLLVLTIGLGTGLVAYFAGFPLGAAAATPDELTMVPSNAVLVASADVKAVMVSEVRQRLLQMFPGPASGQQQFADQTGINLDTDVDRLVACLTSPTDAQGGPPAGLALVRGRFNDTKIESLMRSHGAQPETYNGVRVLAADVRAGDAAPQSMSLAFVEPGLVAVGSTPLVHQAIDLSQTGGANITSNTEVMDFVKGVDTNDAWVVGRFDALTSEAKIPGKMAGQLPPITWFTAGVHIDGGLKGSFRADTRDEASAGSVRDMLRGLLAFAKMQASSHPEVQPMIDSLQLGGTGSTVTVSFDVSPEMFDQLAGLVKGLHGSPAPTSK